MLTEKTFCHENQIQEFFGIIFNRKKGFYSKGIEELPDKWQDTLANNGKYIIE